MARKPQKPSPMHDARKLTPEVIAKMSNTDLAVLSEVLKRFGTLDRSAVVAPTEKFCPHCEKFKNISDFGFRVFKGSRTVASWCKQCRSETSAKYQAIHREKLKAEKKKKK